MCKAASKHYATGPHVAHCTPITLFIGHIYTPQSCHQTTMELSPTAAFQPWPTMPKGRPFAQTLPLFSHFNFRTFRNHIEEGSGTRLCSTVIYGTCTIIFVHVPYITVEHAIISQEIYIFIPHLHNFCRCDIKYKFPASS